MWSSWSVSKVTRFDHSGYYCYIKFISASRFGLYGALDSYILVSVPKNVQNRRAPPKKWFTALNLGGGVANFYFINHKSV